MYSSSCRRVCFHFFLIFIFKYNVVCVCVLCIVYTIRMECIACKFVRSKFQLSDENSASNNKCTFMYIFDSMNFTTSQFYLTVVFCNRFTHDCVKYTHISMVLSLKGCIAKQNEKWHSSILKWKKKWWEKEVLDMPCHHANGKSISY